MNCQLTFLFQLQNISSSDSISILGNLPGLGVWSDPLQHQLTPYLSGINSPHIVINDYFISKKPLIIPQFTSFQYKLVVLSNNKIKYWENLPFNTNRHYYVHKQNTTLKGIEGDLRIEEIPFKLNEIFDCISEEDEIIKNFERKKLINSEQKKRTKSISSNEGSEINDSRSKKLSSNSLEVRITRKLEKTEGRIRERKKKNHKNKNKLESRSVSDTSVSSLVEFKENICSKKELPLITGSFLMGTEEEKQMKKIDLKELYYKMREKYPNKLRYSMLRSQNDIVYQIGDDYEKNMNSDKFVILLTVYLPLTLNLTIKEGKIKKIDVNFNQTWDTLPFNLHIFTQSKATFKKIIWIGMLYQDFPEIYHQQIKQYLIKEHKCIVFFPEKKIHQNFMIYCNDLLDPILNNCYNSACFREIQDFSILWNSFKQICEAYSDIVLEYNKENPFIFICDYHLLLTNIYLSKKIIKPALAFYFSSNFPNFENLQLLPFVEEILNSLLLSNIICFNEFAHARLFFSAISNIFGLKFETYRGLLCIKYMGRQIIVKINAIGVDFTNLDNIKKRDEEYKNKLLLYNEKFKEKKIIFNVDNCNRLHAIDLKLKLYKQFLIDNPEENNIVFLQIINKNYWEHFLLEYQHNIKIYNDYFMKIQTTITEIQNIQNGNQIYIFFNSECDNIFPKEKLNEIWKIFPNQIFNKIDLLALQSISKVVLKCSIKNELGLEALEYLEMSNGRGLALFSCFIVTNPLLNSIIKFSPFRYIEFKEKLKLTLQNYITENNLNQELYKTSNANNWLETTMHELRKSILFSKHANLTKVERVSSHHSLSLLKVATNEFFKYLNFKETIKNYRNAYNRIIIFDYEGTLVTSDQYADCNEYENSPKSQNIKNLCLKPSEIILSGLKQISSDPRNSVFLITGKTKEQLGPWITEIKNLNIFCEFGYLIRLKRTNEWIRLYEPKDWSWKETSRKIMEIYVNNTEGSDIEIKESSIVWKYGNVNEEFGSKQADQLESHLKTILGYLKEIEISRGKYYVEVRPYGLNKGTSAELILQKIYNEKGKIDLILAVGQGISDEEVFASIKSNVESNRDLFDEKRFNSYLCCIGKKPSNAEFYLKNVEDVESFMSKIVSLYKTHKKDSL